ncbi:MAG: gas vesicle protein [Anaerolineales bacterium]|nr:gas vesicle protein [Anaerolineales bacterium]
MLAIYDVQLDNEGSVMGYRRIGRYVRSQVEITNG